MTAPRPPSEVPALDPHEVATGMVFGERRSPDPLAVERGPSRLPPARILERALVRALERPPCFVAFSGGRDSSAILAEATRVARAHGLESPIPHTLRFERAPRTAEDEWQELVIRHLGLAEWSKRSVRDELDALGPLARDLARRRGVHWPANVHTVELMLEPAAGGSLLTGHGGDELFHAWGGHRRALIRRGRARPRRHDLRPILFSALPTPLLAQWARRRPGYQLPWLRPAGARQLARNQALHRMRFARTWQQAVERYLDSRYRELFVAITQAMASDAGVQLVDPFYEPEFVRAVAAEAPPEGYGSRTAVMRRYFGDNLPVEVLNRSTKAVFTEVFTGPGVREFATQWDGSGVEPSLADPDRLRQQWLAPVPELRSMVALQAAWLASVDRSR